MLLCLKMDKIKSTTHLCWWLNCLSKACTAFMENLLDFNEDSGKAMDVWICKLLCNGLSGRLQLAEMLLTNLGTPVPVTIVFQP